MKIGHFLKSLNSNYRYWYSYRWNHMMSIIHFKILKILAPKGRGKWINEGAKMLIIVEVGCWVHEDYSICFAYKNFYNKIENMAKIKYFSWFLWLGNIHVKFLYIFSWLDSSFLFSAEELFHCLDAPQFIYLPYE